MWIRVLETSVRGSSTMRGCQVTGLRMHLLNANCKPHVELCVAFDGNGY